MRERVIEGDLGPLRFWITLDDRCIKRGHEGDNADQAVHMIGTKVILHLRTNSGPETAGRRELRSRGQRGPLRLNIIAQIGVQRVNHNVSQFDGKERFFGWMNPLRRWGWGCI